MNLVRLQRSLTLPNDINTIPQLSEFIESFCDEAGIGMETTMSLNLALEEAVVNVMDYAYPKDTAGHVNIDVRTDADCVVFVITDNGIPFDPTAMKDVDTTLPLEERSIGGLGIFLTRQIMDDISYERSNDKNILTLKKNINNESKQ
ncbi:MAG: ATP-binding protein [Prevotella sp.]|nr:ATP-binding protein [Prevotella sp.]